MAANAPPAVPRDPDEALRFGIRVVEQAYEDGKAKSDAHTATTFLTVDFRSMEVRTR